MVRQNPSKLRRGLNLRQVEAARSMKMRNPSSRASRPRGDHLISTLHRYVEALGGRLDVTAVFGKRRVRPTA